MEKMMDRCGLFGMFDNNGFHTSHLIYYGLFSMQHRGMEAAGICVNDNQGNFSYVKDEGLVTEVFDEMIENYSKYSAHRTEASELMHKKYSRQKIALAFEKQLHELTK